MGYGPALAQADSLTGTATATGPSLEPEQNLTFHWFLSQPWTDSYEILKQDFIEVIWNLLGKFKKNSDWQKTKVK